MQEPNFNDLIHQERTRLLAILPKGADVFCSAGSRVLVFSMG